MDKQLTVLSILQHRFCRTFKALFKKLLSLYFLFSLKRSVRVKMNIIFIRDVSQDGVTRSEESSQPSSTYMTSQMLLIG